MSRKGENIRKRKDGRWEGRYKKGVKENGTTDYGSVYGKTYKEVKTKLLTAKQNLKIDEVPINVEKCFSEVLRSWEETNRIRLKGGTKYRYAYLIEMHIIPELGKLKLSQITSATVNAFLVKKLQNGRLDGKGGLSPSYVSSMMTVISSALSYAVAEQMCPPLKTPIHKPQTEKEELDILSMDEQLVLERYAMTELTPTKVGIMISLYAGLRIGEVCALSWDDIDLENEVIHVRHTVARVKDSDPGSEKKTVLIIDEPKTKASKRTIPIPSTLLPVICEFKKISSSRFVVSDKKTFLSPRTFEYRYHRALEACGVNPVNYHALRHTFATRCVEAGADVKSLSELLGHANVSITLNTYVHSSMSLKKCQLEKMAALTAC